MTQTACKEDVVSEGSVERISLLADLVLYYCRHADQPVLVQLYQAEVRGAPHTHTPHIYTYKHTHTPALLGTVLICSGAEHITLSLLSQ